MAKQITEAGLRALHPKARQYTRTTERRGFLVRVSPGGTKTFIYRFQLNGKVRWMKLGTWPDTSIEEAHQAHAAAAKLVRGGVDAEAIRVGAREKELQAGTVGELAEEWMTRYVQRSRKRPELVRQILDANVLPEWKDRKAKHITRRDAILLLDGIVDRGARIMANRTASVLKQMFEFGLDRDLVDASPVAGLKPPGGEERSRERVLSDDEIRAFWEGLDKAGMSEPFRPALRLLLLTGQRRIELAAARLEHFEGELWKIPAELSKSGRAHVVPLSPTAMALLQEMRAETGESGWLLSGRSRSALKTEDRPIDPKALTRAISRNRKHFDCPPFTIHDLRRTCYTGLQSLGIDPLTVSRVVNHKLPGMAGTYGLYDFLPEKRQALRLWAEYVGEVIEGRGRKVQPMRAERSR